MKELNFYYIKEEYIKYLYNFDKKVPYNKNMTRPYIGVVIEINNIKYFAPLFSPKEQHKKYKKNITHIKIGKDMGLVKLNLMIPAQDDVIELIDFRNIKDKKYKSLLINQNIEIQNKIDTILKCSKKIHNFVYENKNDFFVSISCNFKLLEEKSIGFKS